MGAYVAVAGNLASGKSTLAGALAEHFGWPHLPSGSYDRTYLDDLFRDPERWSFEAQMAFLAHKVEAVEEAMRSPTPAVLDRSLSEDVDVLARYFCERGWMSRRAYDLYMCFARMQIERLDGPAVLIYCKAPPAVCRERMGDRKARGYQSLYPDDHLAQLHQVYEKWWTSVGARVKFSIETTRVDTRNPYQNYAIAHRVERALGVH